MTYEPEVNHRILGAFTPEPGQSPAEQLERRLDFIVRELDECMVLAANPETYPLIEGKAIELSMIQTRIQLVLSFIISHRPSKLKIVSNQ